MLYISPKVTSAVAATASIQGSKVPTGLDSQNETGPAGYEADE